MAPSLPHGRRPYGRLLYTAALIPGLLAAVETAAPPNPLRDAYFGDLHVHTRYSIDAYLFGVRNDPDHAYRFARGEAIEHPSGFRFRLRTGPLDFLAVTDHGAFLHVMPAVDDPENPFFAALGPGGNPEDAPLAAHTGDGRNAWQATIEAAERHNDPGSFTTFIGYEYTAFSEGRGNLHRNVIFKGSEAPPRPFTANDSNNPEDLWQWLDERRAEGFEALAIPHNSNGSNGQMFRLERLDGAVLDANHADQRNRNEPLVEITQGKGTSETHPLLSPNDEWADFEIYAYRIGTTLPSQASGGHVREAYLNGLVLQETRGFNPFRFGLIGSTDSHNAGGPLGESNFHGNFGTGDGTPERRGSVPLEAGDPAGRKYSQTNNRYYSGAGLTGVWAEQNTRGAIYAALRRRETFATTGPRVRIRFFAGHDYPDELAADPEMIARAYEGGVPMGGDLLADGGKSPRFLIWAARDADSAPLQRLQIVKGWVEDGEPREAVVDVACADGGMPSGEPRRCPDNGARVDLSDCSFPRNAGAAELSALWRDPDFDAGQHAVYYVRVLENPTCRWSTWDALRAGVEPRPDLPATLQERAWSSPIWYVPGR